MNQIEPPWVKELSATDSLSTATHGGSSFGDTMQSKTCTRCGEEKPLSEFYPDKSRSSGYHEQCKACKMEQRNALHNKQREVENARCFNRYHEDPMKAFAYRMERRERVNQQCRERYHRNPSKAKEYGKKYLKLHWARVRAGAAVTYAIRMGRLTRPTVCSGTDCRGVGRIEAHHWSYRREHWLDVIWLCQSCHKRIDHSQIEEG